MNRVDMSMTDNGLNDSLSQPRLMLVSSRVRNKPAIVAAALPHVRVIEYSYDTTTLDDLMTMIEQRLQGRRVRKPSFLEGTFINFHRIFSEGILSSFSPA